MVPKNLPHQASKFPDQPSQNNFPEETAKKSKKREKTKNLPIDKGSKKSDI